MPPTDDRVARPERRWGCRSGTPNSVKNLKNRLDRVTEKEEDMYLTQKTSVIHVMIENTENTAKVPENPEVIQQCWLLKHKLLKTD